MTFAVAAIDRLLKRLDLVGVALAFFLVDGVVRALVRLAVDLAGVAFREVFVEDALLGVAFAFVEVFDLVVVLVGVFFTLDFAFVAARVVVFGFLVACFTVDFDLVVAFALAVVALGVVFALAVLALGVVLALAVVVFALTVVVVVEDLRVVALALGALLAVGLETSDLTSFDLAAGFFGVAAFFVAVDVFLGDFVVVFFAAA